MDAVTRTAFSSTANFEVRSSKLLNVRTSCFCATFSAESYDVVTLRLVTFFLTALGGTGLV
jgi:hypothetical protein